MEHDGFKFLVGRTRTRNPLFHKTFKHVPKTVLKWMRDAFVMAAFKHLVLEVVIVYRDGPVNVQMANGMVGLGYGMTRHATLYFLKNEENEKKWLVDPERLAKVFGKKQTTKMVSDALCMAVLSYDRSKVNGNN